MGSRSDFQRSFVLYIFPVVLGASNIYTHCALGLGTASLSYAWMLDSWVEIPQGREIIWGALCCSLKPMWQECYQQGQQEHIWLEQCCCRRVARGFQHAMSDRRIGRLESFFFSLPSFLPPWLAAPPTFTSFSTGFFPVSPPSPAVSIPQPGHKESGKQGKSPGLQG